MSVEIANFFWSGNDLSFYENVCLQSFIKNGFEVHIYSYSNLSVPEGASLKDASEILPQEELLKYTQGGEEGNLAAFSDHFRYKLLETRAGWWFDIDVICLRSSSDFFRLRFENPLLTIGRSNSKYLNGAVLYIDDKTLFNWINVELNKAGRNFEWGTIGPKLLSKMVEEKNLQENVIDSSVFYPIHYSELEILFNPEEYERALAKCNKSYSLHLWNEFLNRWNIPKNILPPEGSFIYQIFLKICPEYNVIPSLPYSTFKSLMWKGQKEDEFYRLKKFERKVKKTVLYKFYNGVKSYYGKK